MRTTMEEEFKHWKVKRKAQLALDVLQGLTIVLETSRTFGSATSEI